MASNSEASCFCLLSPGLLSRTGSDATFTKHTAAAFPWEEVEVWSELDGEPVIGLCCLVLFSLIVLYRALRLRIKTSLGLVSWDKVDPLSVPS